MKKYILALLIVCYGGTLLYGQMIDRERIGVGFNLGGQKLFGDITNTGFGIGLESYVKYRINNKFSAGAALGYGELSDATFNLDKSTFTTNMITFDVRGAYHLQTDFLLKPSVYLGVGVINFKNEKFDQRYFDGAFYYGGAFEYMLNPQIGLPEARITGLPPGMILIFPAKQENRMTVI